MALSICAVIAARNEHRYLEELLPILAAQAVDVVILDNGSTDGSRDLYPSFTPVPIRTVEHFPFRGAFQLSDQLERKARIVASLRHEWVIHQDADEILEHREPGKTLRDAIEDADNAGATVVNFDEFVFLPDSSEGDAGKRRHVEGLTYYFFETHEQRLQRAWRRDAGLDNRASGGHALAGPGHRIASPNHNLRHYIGLSQQHLWDKYLSRRFDEAELRAGWHANRIGLSREQLTIPREAPFLRRLPHPSSKDFCRDHPVRTHYWHWAVSEEGGQRLSDWANR